MNQPVISPTPHNRQRSAKAGFTLVELLVVIGIIAVLMGILIPTVTMVRRAAQDAATGVEVSNLSNAITNYHSDFGSYPGPFSNDQIEFGANNATFPTPPTIPMQWYDTTTSPPSYKQANIIPSPGSTPYPQFWTVTGAQNLVLGLMGGLRVDSTGAPAFAPTEVGLGPLSLDPANPRRYQNYVSSSSGNQSYLDPAWKPASPAYGFTAQQGGAIAGDSPFPVFVDRYPNPLPMLFLRARIGAKGIVSDGKETDPSGAIAQYQYDTREIYAYVKPDSNVGLPIVQLPAPGINHNLLLPQAGPNPDWENFINHADTTPGLHLLSVVKKGQTSSPDSGAYFADPSSPAINYSTDNQYNFTGRPRQVDQYILISAGSDGIYGTADDKTNFGDVTR